MLTVSVIIMASSLLFSATTWCCTGNETALAETTPAEYESTSEYVPEKTTSESVAEKTTSESVAEKTTSESVAEKTTSESVAEKTTSESVAEKTTSESVAEKTTSDSVAEKTTSEAVTEETTSEVNKTTAEFLGPFYIYNGSSIDYYFICRLTLGDSDTDTEYDVALMFDGELDPSLTVKTTTTSALDVTFDTSDFGQHFGQWVIYWII